MKVKNFFLVFITIFSIKNVAFSNVSKHVIGYPGKEYGFFAALMNVLNDLAWSEKNHKIPVVYWDETTVYYQPEGFNGSKNVWEYYFEPVSTESFKQGDDVISTAHLDGYTDFYKTEPHHFLNKEQRKLAHRFLVKYIKIKAPIEAKINDFCNKYMKGKRTIGIHLRGTDKYKEIKPVNLELIFAEANKYQCDQYLIATDEQILLDKAISLLNKPVIYYNSYRSTDGQPLHFSNYPHKAQLGEEILIEAKLLSVCDRFIHTRSNVAKGVLYFNPSLEHTLML